MPFETKARVTVVALIASAILTGGSLSLLLRDKPDKAPVKYKVTLYAAGNQVREWGDVPSLPWQFGARDTWHFIDAHGRRVSVTGAVIVEEFSDVAE